LTIATIQYTRNITDKLKFVIKSQGFVDVDRSGHLYSPVRSRGGLNCKRYLFGLASDIYFFENDFRSAKNYGLFIQYKIL